MGVKRSKGSNSQSGGTLWVKGGIGLGDVNCVNDWQLLRSLALSVRSGSHLGGEERLLESRLG